MDLTILVAEAIYSNKEAKERILKLYKENKFKAYSVAKESELYSHHIITDGNIEREVSLKRILGVLLLMDDPDICKSIINILQKSFKRLFNYIKNENEINIETVSNKFTNDNMSDDEYNGILYMSIFLAEIILDKRFITNDPYRILVDSMKRRIIVNLEDGNRRFSYQNLNSEELENGRKILNRIRNIYKVAFNYIDEIFNISDLEIKKYIDSLSLLFDSEDLMVSSIASSQVIEESILEEICSLYYIKFKNQNKNDAVKFLIASLFIKLSIISLKDVKNFYFQNNQETMFFEISNFENEIVEMKNENNFLQKSLDEKNRELDILKKRYKNEIENDLIEKERKIKILRDEIIEMKNEYNSLKEETSKLREYIFLADENDIRMNEIEKIPKIFNEKGLIIGGHSKFFKEKIEQFLPNFTFIDGDSYSNKESLENIKNFDVIFFYTDYLGHPAYVKAISQIRKNGKKFGYISHSNPELALKEIERIIK